MNDLAQTLLKKWNPASATARLVVAEITDVLLATGDLKTDIKTYKNVRIAPQHFAEVKHYFKHVREIFDDNNEYSLLGINGTFPDDEFLCAGLNKEEISSSGSDESYFRLFCTGNKKQVDDFMEFVKPFKHVKVPQIEWVTSVSNGVNSSHIAMKAAKPIDKSFYPCLNGESVDAFVKRFMDSDATILLLIGPPGLGKTELITQIIWAANAQCMLTFSDAVSSSDSLFTYFIESDANILLVEDADTMLSARKNGNDNMKRILNISDGLTARKDKKFIFTTNLPSLASVDPALLRPGRCFKTLEFKRFNHEQALEIAAFINVELPEQEDYSLAEIFAVRNNEYTEVDDQPTINNGIGF